MMNKDHETFKIVDELFESLRMRVLTKMMLAGMTSYEKGSQMCDMLTRDEYKMLSTLVETGFVDWRLGKYYLTRRGCSIGSMGLKKLVDMNVTLPWEKKDDRNI